MSESIIKNDQDEVIERAHEGRACSRVLFCILLLIGIVYLTAAFLGYVPMHHTGGH